MPINCIIDKSNSTFNNIAKIGDRSRTLISFNDPGIPKKACYIQRSCEATASRIIVGSRQWPVYIPCHAIGHFFHFQCIQSMLPNIPGNPRCSPIDNQQISASFGALRYQSPKTSKIALTKALRLSIAVGSPIRRYSSLRSAGISYASILWAAVTFEGKINQEHREHLSFVWNMDYELPLHLRSEEKDDDSS